MPTGSMAAAGLIQALNSQKTVKATTNMVKAVNGVNEAENNGTWETIEGISANFQGGLPFMVLFKLVLAEIQKGTTSSTVTLIKDVIELMNNPLVETGLTTINKTINLVTDSASDMISLFNNLVENIPGLTAALDKLNRKVEDTTPNIASFTGAVIGFDKEMQNMVGIFWDHLIELTKTKEGMQKILNSFDDLFEDLGDGIKRFFEKLKDAIRKWRGADKYSAIEGGAAGTGGGGASGKLDPNVGDELF